MIVLCTLASSAFFPCSFVFDWSFHHALQSSDCFSIVSRTSSPFGSVDCRSKKNYPKKLPEGGWASPFCRAKSGSWHPRPLQNEEPATNLARGFLYKIKAPNPLFLAHFCDFQKHWPLQSGEPGMSKHLSRIATWKKENHQKYTDPFCRGMMWKNLGLPVSPENPET